MRDTILRYALSPNSRNSLPSTALIGLTDKVRTIKGLVVCNLVWLGSTILSMGWVFKTISRFVGLVPCCGQDGYHPIDKCIYNNL